MNFIGGFAGSLRDRRTGLHPDPSGADSLHVSVFTPHIEFHAASSIAITGTIPISEGLQVASDKENFQQDNRNGCEKYNDSDDDEWFLEFDENGNDLYMKQCKAFIEPIAESKDKKKGTKTDEKVAKSKEKRDPDVEMMVRHKKNRRKKLIDTKN